MTKFYVFKVYYKHGDWTYYALDDEASLRAYLKQAFDDVINDLPRYEGFVHSFGEPQSEGDDDSLEEHEDSVERLDDTRVQVYCDGEPYTLEIDFEHMELRKLVRMMTCLGEMIVESQNGYGIVKVIKGEGL